MYNPTDFGDTTPLIKSGYEQQYADLLKCFPFNKIEKRTVDGQEMTFFPKTYCKVTGEAGAGRAILFAPKPLDSSWKLMTCFYDFTTGAEVEEGVCHARYMATNNNGVPESKATGTFWGSIPYTDIRTKARLRGTGWNPLNIWDYHYRGLLMLLETLAMGYTVADCQTAIGGVDGSMGVTHYGITNVWGGTDKGFWIHGLDTFNGAIDGVTISNTNFHIVGKDGVRRDTGIAPAGSSIYPQTFQTKQESEYDLNELFLGASGNGTENQGSCGDCQILGTGGAFYSPWNASYAGCGPFYLGNYSPSFTYGACGFALRKAV